MDVESTIRETALETNNDTPEATEELKRRVENDLKEMEEKYGRVTTSQALRNVKSLFTIRRFINPYPIPDKHFEALVKYTDGFRIHSPKFTPEEMANEIHTNLDERGDTVISDVEYMYESNDDMAILALVDMVIPDVYREGRNQYVSKTTEHLKDIINEDE